MSGNNKDSDVVKAGLNIAAGGFIGATAVNLISDAPPDPHYIKSVDEVAITRAVDAAYESKPQASDYKNPADFVKAEKEWAKTIAQNALTGRDTEQAERDQPKQEQENKELAGGIVGIGVGALASAINIRRRKEEKEENHRG